MKRYLFWTSVVFVIGVCSAYAHHSFASTYIEDKTVTIKGTIKEFQFRNPHSFVTIEVTDTKGEVQRWGVEWGGSTQLAGQGINAHTFKVGDVVTISGAPGRTAADHRILMKTLRRESDGKGWGSSPGEVVE